MPLDLHVLSLPLAFILSQDQTLRCLYIVSYFTVLVTILADSQFVLTGFHSMSVYL